MHGMTDIVGSTEVKKLRPEGLSYSSGWQIFPDGLAGTERQSPNTGHERRITTYELRESSEFTSMMGLGSWRMARTNAATNSGSNCVLAQRSTSARASSAARPFL